MLRTDASMAPVIDGKDDGGLVDFSVELQPGDILFRRVSPSSGPPR